MLPSGGGFGKDIECGWTAEKETERGWVIGEEGIEDEWLEKRRRGLGSPEKRRSALGLSKKRWSVVGRLGNGGEEGCLAGEIVNVGLSK
ncbi:hypothetical protein FF1_008699 [Malus domestica]